MVEIKQDMWRRCLEHLLGENTNTNTISLIHLRFGTYFISRHPHWSHESPHLLAGSQRCSSCFHDNPDASLLQSLPTFLRYSFKNKHGRTASQVMTQENALKCSYKIQNLLKTQLENSQSITRAISATGHGWISWVPLSESRLFLCRLPLFSWQLMQRKGHF